MPLKQLTIEDEDRGTQLTVLYNPEEYTVNNDNNFAVQNVPGLGSPIVQFVNGNHAHARDGAVLRHVRHADAAPSSDVREQTGQVVGLMDIDRDLHAPPVLRVQWGSLDFALRARARQPEVHHVHADDGVPVRARLHGHVQRVHRPRAGGQGGQPADRRLHARCTSSSQRRDAQRHRRAAATSDPTRGGRSRWPTGIADPRALAPGQALRVPSLPFRDPDTGEVVTLMAALPAYAPSSPSGSTASRCRRRCAPRSSSVQLHGRHGGRRPGRDRRWPTTACSGSTTRCCRWTPASSCRIGYAPDPLEQVFVGEITGVEASFPASGMPTVTRGRARLPAAAHDRHQGPRLRPEHPDRRQVPVARPGGRGARRRDQPAHPVPRPRRARRCRSSSCWSPTRSTPSRPSGRSASSRARATSTS